MSIIEEFYFEICYNIIMYNRGIINIIIIILGIILIAVLLGFFTSSNLRVY